MAQNPTSGQVYAYNGAQSTGRGVIYDALGNPVVIGANMPVGAGAGKALISDASGNLTPGTVGAASLPAATTTTQGAVVLDGTAADIATDGNQAAGSTGKAADSGHVHPSPGVFTPADGGFISWNFDPAITNSNSAPNSGDVNLVRVDLRAAASITGVAVVVYNSGTGLTSGQNFLGLYDSAGTRVGVSADQTAAFGTGQLVKADLASGPFALAAGFYWVAILAKGSGPPTFTRGQVAAQNNLALTAANYRWAVNGTGATALPSNVTPSANSGLSLAFWAALY